MHYNTTTVEEVIKKYTGSHEIRSFQNTKNRPTDSIKMHYK